MYALKSCGADHRLTLDTSLEINSGTNKSIYEGEELKEVSEFT